MSTKIFNGWIIDGTDMKALRLKMQKLSASVKKTARKFMAKTAAWQAAHLIDKHAVLGKKLDQASEDMALPLNATILRFCEFQIRENVQRSFNKLERSSFDLDCSAVAFPMTWKGKDITPILFYDNSLGEMFTPAFKRIVKPTEFCYWNNVDPPDDVSDSAWNERDKLWEKAMGGYRIPEENGFTFKFLGYFSVPFLTNEEVIAELPKIEFDTRVDRTAEWIQTYKGMIMVQKRWVREKLPEHTSNMFKELREWERSKRGLAVLKAAKEKARKVLKREITAKDLEAPMSTIAKEVKKKQNETS